MPKKTTKKTTPKETTKQLIQSNMLLQSKLIDLVQSNNNLTKQISTMVKFFHEAGQRMAVESEEEKLKPLFERLNALLDQNKAVIRGLLLIQKYIKSSAIQEESAKPLTPSELEF